MSRLRKYLPFLVSLLCLLAAAPCGAQDARARLHMLNVFLATPLDSRALEQEKVRKIRAVELQARDEFETQAMFEKRKAEASSRVKEIEQEYAQKLAEARRKFDQRIAEITKEREQLLLAGTDVASPFTVGSYDADKQQFTVALSKTGQSFPLPMPLQVARQFKTASGTLTATGKQYLAADESYDYADWQVTFEGRTCRFGPQKGVQQIASTVKVQPAAPPSLKTTVSFAEPSGNLKLDANETAELTVTIVNNGRGSAFGFEINATLEHASDVEISSPSYVGEIPAGQTRTAKLTIKGGIGVTDGVASCLLSYNEANGFAPAGNKITFETKALIPPRLVLIPGVRVDDLGKTGKIRPGEQVSITARIQNTGLGEAKRVRIRIASGDPNVFFAPGAKTEDDVASMPSGAYHDITFSIFTNLQATSVPVEITATESYGKYGILSQVLPLSFDKQIAGIEELTVKGREDQHGDVKIAGGLSIDVDEDIPKAGVKNADAVALVIGISRYKNPDVPTVDYARHGAAIMKDYLVSALGYDNKRIIYAEDENAGLADFKKMFQKLTNMVRPGRSDVFVYYNGHGAPDTKTNESEAPSRPLRHSCGLPEPRLPRFYHPSPLHRMPF